MVQFLKDYKGHLTLGNEYKAGEQATFHDYVEVLLVQKGIAKFPGDEPKEAAPVLPVTRRYTRTKQKGASSNG